MQKILLLISLLLLGASLPHGSLKAQSTTIKCTSTMTLQKPTTKTTSSVLCYRFKVPKNSIFFLIDLESLKGDFDLYVKSGASSLLQKTNQVNIDSVNGRLTYIVFKPDQDLLGTYTIGIVPQSKLSKFYLHATIPTSSEQQPIYGCDEEAEACTLTYSIVPTGEGIVMGSNFGDEILAPFDLTNPSWVEANMTWEDSDTHAANTLDMSLYGENGSQQRYRRVSGQSPLDLAYEVAEDELELNSEWKIRLKNNNLKGGFVDGKLTISYTASQ